MPPPTQGIGALPSAFFETLADSGFRTQVANIPSIASGYEEPESFYAAVRRFGSRSPDIVHAMRPLSPEAVREIAARMPDATLSVGIDRPSEIGLWGASIMSAKAAILPDESLFRTLPAGGRLQGLSQAGAFFFIAPGIDLDAFDPDNDRHISRYSHTDPGRKANNYISLMGLFKVYPNRDAQNIAYIGEGPEALSLIERAINEFHPEKHYILGRRMPPETVMARLQKIREGHVTFADATKEKNLHMILAGSAIAVFLPEQSSPEFASDEMVRSILMFMRYGAMPVVPQYVACRGIVKPCVLSEGTSTDVWLHPTGFGFFYDPRRPSSMSDAIGTASMHEFRTKIGHGIHSRAVPNAMIASHRHCIRGAARAYARAFTGMRAI